LPVSPAQPPAPSQTEPAGQTEAATLLESEEEADADKATSPPPEPLRDRLRGRDGPPKADREEVAPPTGGTGPGASDFSGPALIEHLLMEAHVRMTVADYANAVKVYQKLIDVAPNVGAYHGRLAIAMACYPRTSKQAEREFIEAVRLDPDNADLHYQFGLYYKAMKQRSRALHEMRTAVRLNPKHKTAREELEVLSPKDSALTSLKKLFR
jgi:tetratricopeptide (TPR) repeat protein